MRGRKRREVLLIKKIAIPVLIAAGIICSLTVSYAFSSVIREGDRVYIVDRKGEKWDVTQAESIGFKPEGFQYGLGRNFFSPLNDSHLSDDTGKVSPGLRVLGVKEDRESRAYSIPKLSRHEIANSKIGDKPIAVGY